MNELKIFKNPTFGQIRVVEVDGEPWFVGKDVAESLGHENPARAIRKFVDDEDKGETELVTPGGKQNAIIINESGLYSLALSSKLPSAKQFKRWITSEVIPSIRKTGGYIATAPDMTDAEIMAKALLVAQRTIEDRDKRIQSLTEENSRMKPKAIFTDAVTASTDTILIGELAKILKQNGVKTGQNRLFEQLRNEGYLVKVGKQKNMPTQKAMEMGLFEVKERTINNPDGSIRITKTTLVTGKGQVYFTNHFLNN